jgi:hemolysin activation/secretion protein
MIKTNRSTWSLAMQAALITLAAASGAAWSQALPAAGQVNRDAGMPSTSRDTAPVNVTPFSSGPAVTAAAVSVKVEGIKFSGNRTIASSELEPLVADSVGQTLNLAGLDKLADRVSRFYRSKGYTVARAYLPPQHSADGIIQIAIIEGQYAALNLKNSSSIATDRLQKMVASSICKGETSTDCKGQTITDAGLERAALLVKDLPGVTAAVSLKPGAGVGTSDLDMTVQNTKNQAYYLGFDNYGAASTGKNRLNLSAEFNNPNNNGDQLTAGVSTTDKQGANSGSVAYSLPVGYNGARAGVALARSQYRLGGTFKDIDSHGTSNALSAFGSYPLIRSINQSLYLRGSLENRALLDHIDSTGYMDKKNATVARFGFNGDSVDSIGGGGYNIYGVTVSSGNVRNSDAAKTAADAASAHLLGSFRKVNYNIARQQAVSGPFTLYGSVTGQQAGKNLDGSEQIGIAGPTAVRAYAGEGGGSTGAVASIELRYTTPVSLFDVPANLTYGLFVDRGWVKVYQTSFAGMPANNTRGLTGTGASATLQARSYYLRGMVASHKASEASTVDNATSKFWLQGGVNF